MKQNETLLKNYQEYLKRERILKSFGYDSRRANAFVASHALPLKGKILEIGTGKGRVTALLAKRVPHLTTVDIDVKSQRQAKLYATYRKVRPRIRFLACNAESLPFPEHSFDAVVSANVLHHMKRPYRVLEEILRVTRPTGKIILSDPDRSGLKAMAKMHQAEGKEHPGSGVHVAQAARWLKKKGWTVSIQYGAQEDLLIAQRNNDGD